MSTTAPPAALSFDHFRIKQNAQGLPVELGRGAMGVTYEALDTNLNSRVALKLMSGASLRSAVAKQRFLREARAAAQLNHPHLAKVFHLGEREGQVYFVMEYVDGVTTEQVIRAQGPLNVDTVLRIAIQSARGLSAMEKQGVLHRDIKPANIMLENADTGPDLFVKLIDFGLAKPLSDEVEASITQAGFVGTPHYASPEQLEEKPMDHRSDLYALGSTLWYLLTGKPPFTGSVASVMSQHINAEPNWEELEGVPQAVVEVLKKVLAKRPEDRLPNARELRNQAELLLGTFFASFTLTGSRAPLLPRTETPPQEAMATQESQPARLPMLLKHWIAAFQRRWSLAGSWKYGVTSGLGLLLVIFALSSFGRPPAIANAPLSGMASSSLWLGSSLHFPHKTGWVWLQALPNDARVSLPNSAITHPLPLLIAGVSEQAFEITVEKPGYISQTLTVTPQDERPLRPANVKLAPQPSTLEVATSPTGVPFTLWKQGRIELQGQTPFVAEALLPGDYELVLKQENRKPLRQLLTLAPGQHRDWSWDFSRNSVTIESAPARAEVFDAEEALLGFTPITVTVNPGEQAFSLRMAGYENQTLEVVLDDPESETNYLVNLTPVAAPPEKRTPVRTRPRATQPRNWWERLRPADRSRGGPRR